ncbi:Phototropic-responsive NPH3 family protein isoform 2 [Tripterygium wilfordii]|uniref:Phototropic-responsive NPH3 family protein isoform 2 n=1 Tax=Tripterygium wilfordii TaxID=458696 RepID=A0A7J7CGM6_TRIWF|nr:BTB/POZ domain-containing protein NPY2-like [Tripterygium wilfordii]KAF5733196.1 Phototropic-responsive NPH3 family protein isoform 2 [Tripterygium wilfordii]
MKYMKLGSKPDSFQTDGNNVRYAASELATDIIINVGEVKFYLHKFPLLSKSTLLQKLVASGNGDNSDEVDISNIPGGPASFEICVKFCYGITVTLNAYNVVAARCTAEYLGMHESVEKGNLIHKIEVFLTSCIFRSWKDSIIVVQTTKSLLPLSEDLKVVSRCIDAIATKTCVDVSRVDWSYTYNRKKLQEENGDDPNLNDLRHRSVPMDWWAEDLCELEIDLYRRVIMNIKTSAVVPSDVIGEALKTYAYMRLPGLNKGMIKSGEMLKSRPVVDTIVWLLPADKDSVSTRFLLKLMKAALCVDAVDMVKAQLIQRIGQQLEGASINDLLILSAEGEKGETVYDVDTIKTIVQEFLMQDQIIDTASPEVAQEVLEIRRPGILSDASKLMVAKMTDAYLAEIAKDHNLPLSKFIELADMVSGIPRPVHDGLYRAIDIYLKEHPGISKSERKRICKLMDCKKLSVDACMHVVQNERLPLRVLVQVLFNEQVRVAASSGCSTPDPHRSIRDLNCDSRGSSRSATTNQEEELDPAATAEELRALKRELASLRLSNGVATMERNGESKNGVDRAAIGKMKGLLKSKKKILTKLWSSKGGHGENSGSDSPESLGSANFDEAKCTPSRNRRYSVS